MLSFDVYFLYLPTSAKFIIYDAIHIYDVIALINKCRIPGGGKILEGDVPSRFQKHTRSLYQFFQNVYPTLYTTFSKIYTRLYTNFPKMHTRPYTNCESCENRYRSLYQNRDNRYRSLYQNLENRYPSRWHVPIPKICIVPPPPGVEYEK